MKEMFNQIVQLADKNEIYVVGGWLRDRMLKRNNKDIDFVTSMNPLILARKVASVLEGTMVQLDKENGIYRVVLINNPFIDYLDFSKFKGSNIYNDLNNRDFTINSMALRLSENFVLDKSNIIDPLNGLKDLKNKKIRMTSKKIFKDDPLRILRAFRFSSELNFKIDNPVKTLIKKDAKLITKVAGERIKDELFKILAAKDSNVFIQEIDKLKVLDKIFPLIIKMKKSARKFYFHPLGLWQHAIETLFSLELVMAKLSKFFPKNHTNLKNHLEQPFSQNVTRLGLLKLVALFHDIAKPLCAKRFGKRMRFLGHEAKGAKIVLEILRKLKLGNKEIRAAQNIIANHMRPISLGQAAILTDRASYRLFRDIQDELPELALLSLADCYSYKRLKTKKAVELKKHIDVMKELINRYYCEKAKGTLPRLIDGNILMKEFNLKPGPIIGFLLKNIQEAQALNKISSKEDALTFAKKLLTRRKKTDKI